MKIKHWHQPTALAPELQSSIALRQGQIIALRFALCAASRSSEELQVRVAQTVA